MFKSIKNREPLSIKIVADIEKAIRSKKIPIDGKLPSEKELCSQFNVGRNVLREALKVLSGMGLINIQKGKGVFVNDITTESVSNHIESFIMVKFEKEKVLDINYVREIIEPNIVASAALNRTDEDIRLLKENVKKFCDPKIDFNDRSLLDGEFHLLIAKATKNFYLPLILIPIYNVIAEIRQAVFQIVKESGNSAEIWHKKILDAIIKQDSEKAKMAAIRHLEISKHNIQKWIKK